MDFKDFQNLLIAEKLNDIDEIKNRVWNQEELELSKESLQNISYDELFDSLKEIKKSFEELGQNE